MTSRITQTFSKLTAEKRTALIPFIMAGDTSAQITAELLTRLPEAGADIIELGMPFSDPSADGVAIQAAAVRALNGGMTLHKTLELVRDFRAKNHTTPLILMGYYNPIYHYGSTAFAKDAAAAGVDGVIIVDLPPEEEGELIPDLQTHQIDLIRLIAPTTNDARLSKLLASASGFVYTIAIKGITGAGSANQSDLNARLTHIRAQTALPVVAGFGIRTPEQAAALHRHADGVVVGSALVDTIASCNGDLNAPLDFIKELSKALHYSHPN